MTHLAERILLLPPAVALLLVFALPALEASAFVGFIVPGEIGVILGGVLANQHKLPLWAALVAGIAGAVIGDSIGYEVGKRYGERILTKIPNRILKQEHLDRAKESVRRNGGKAVFVGRFTAALRVLVPGFSGMSRIPYSTFLAWNAAGGALWASAFVLLGYAAGEGASPDDAQDHDRKRGRWRDRAVGGVATRYGKKDHRVVKPFPQPAAGF